ncbi:hypothetical protein D7231_30360 [Streptomyces klenkii]|uniref:Uncharacterized protein n=1 Tax=Streptomyces klenkii TaxID=1420899 RepID=A0A3B0AR71_9ACTN|nr:hypothetical protein D7231_30360 [Streptomyces klenkii]
MVRRSEDGICHVQDPRDRATGPGAWPTLDWSDDMHDLIVRFLERVRALFKLSGFGKAARAQGTADVARELPEPITDPGQVELPSPHPADPPQHSACGVYLWATAHGIDLRPQAPLFTCTCSAKEPKAAPASVRDELRAKVADVNHRSRREHGLS